MYSIKRILTQFLTIFVLAGTVVGLFSYDRVSAQSPFFSKISPLNGTMIVLPATTYQLLQWSDAGIASTDRYQYCIDETDNSVCDNNNWFTRNSTYSGGPGEFLLTVGHTYYWQVRVRDTGSLADNGTWWKFTVQDAVTFTKVSPANGAIIYSPTTTYQFLQWNDTPKDSTDRYQYCVDEINNSLCDKTWITRDSLYSGGPDEFPVLAGHTYYWQVRLRDAGTLSNNGTWWSFTINQPANSLTKLSPAPDVIIPMPSTTYLFLQWSEVMKAATDRYQYCIDEVNNSVCDGKWITRDSTYSGGPGEFALSDGHTYYWQVRLRDAGTLANNGSWWSFTIKPTKPSVLRITRTAPSPTSSASLGFAVTFSETVTGVDAADFTLSSNLGNAAITSVVGSGNQYFVSVNASTGSGNLRLDLQDNDTIKNVFGTNLGGLGVGNGNFTNGESYIVDRTPPAILSIVRADINPTNATSVRFSVTFTEDVTGVDLSDFSLITSAGATFDSISGSGANYIVTVKTGAGTDTLRLDFIDNKSIIDIVGSTTNSGFTAGESYSIDRTPPTVTSITQVSQPETFKLAFAISFTETVQGVDITDFQLSSTNGATLANVTGSGNIYTVYVSLMQGNDTLQLSLLDNDSILDTVGNMLGGSEAGNGNYTGGSVNISVSAPKVTSIIRASPNPTNSQSVDFIVTFSEPVTGVDASDFQASNGIPVTVNNQNPFFVVTVNTISDGLLKLDLIDNDSIVNSQGVALGGSGLTNGNFLNGESFTIDKTPPRVSSIVRAGANPATGATADFIVTFSEPISGVELSDFTVLQTGVIKSTVANIKDVNPFYWVVVNTGAGSGAIRLDLSDNGNITDAAGNKLENNNFIAGESFNISKVAVEFPAPILAVPTSVATQSPILTFSWSGVTNAQAYEYFIANDSAFLQIVSVQTVYETTNQMQLQVQDGIYFIRVRAYDQNLNSGRFSNVVSVLVDLNPPAAPRPLTPKNGDEAPRRPWLRWTIIPDATQYQLEVDNDSDFFSPVFSTTTRDTSIQTSSQLPRRTYYWRVRAQDAAGNWSVWSTVFIFKIP